MSINELIARAVGCIDADRCNGRMEPGTCWDCVENAAAVITALESAGYAIVPLEPTEKMLGAYVGNEALGTAWCLSADDAAKFYRAMLQAHKGDG